MASKRIHPEPLPVADGTWQERWAAQEAARAKARIKEAEASLPEVRKKLAALGIHIFPMKDAEGRYRVNAGRQVKHLKMDSVHDVISRAWTADLDLVKQTIEHKSHGNHGDEWNYPQIMLKRPWTLQSWTDAIVVAYKAEKRKVSVQEPR